MTSFWNKYNKRIIGIDAVIQTSQPTSGDITDSGTAEQNSSRICRALVNL